MTSPLTRADVERLLAAYGNDDPAAMPAFMELFASAPDLARQLLASMTENEKMREALAVARPLIYEGMSNHVEGTPTCADWNKRSEIFFAMHDALPSPPSPKG